MQVEKFVMCWDAFGDYLKRRPAAIVGMIVGVAIFLFAQTYLLTTQPLQQAQIDKVTQTFCSGTNPDTEKCRALMQVLLDSASEDQKKQLAKMVKEQ